MRSEKNAPRKLRRVWLAALVLMAVVFVFGGRSRQAAGSAAAPEASSYFLVVFKNQADLTFALNIKSYAERTQKVYAFLTDFALTSQREVRALITAAGAKYRPFYIVNSIAVYGDAALKASLEKREEVAYTVNLPNMVSIDGPADEPETPPVYIPGGDIPEPVYPVAADEIQDSSWGIEAIGAPQVWSEFNVNGSGIIVGSSDTGVDWTHPDLKPAYAGSENGHDYTWFDPWFGRNYPNDWMGHGTHTVGTMVGQGNIGVAPGAKWIGCGSLGRGAGNAAYYMDCMQFLFAPFPQNGDPFRDGNPLRGAQVTNNSWTCHSCNADVLKTAVTQLAYAGQANVFAAGNAGPTCSTVGNPGFAEAVITVGALSRKLEIAPFSSRGPILVDNSRRIKPDIMAPGMEIYSAFPDNKYSVAAGTSMAAPHIAGTIALLWSARPDLAGNLPETRRLLQAAAGAVTVPSASSCGGDGSVPNNLYGHGNINAYTLVQMALGK